MEKIRGMIVKTIEIVYGDELKGEGI